VAARLWGIWTRGKLDILSQYLDAFTTATKNKSAERIYIDVFAGGAENSDRITHEAIAGSALIACSTANPPFTRLRFIELESKAKKLSALLTEQFPGRDIRVYPGDCNIVITDVLKDMKSIAWAPTFAFVDPNGPDTRWETLEALAKWKGDSKYKVELWILFPAALFARLLPNSNERQVRDEDGVRITSMFGTEDWVRIYEAKLRGEIHAADAREEYVNLMRWRLENILGYKWTHPLEVKNEHARPMYHMIFATDNEAGTRIMSSLYAKAAADFPAMRRAARKRRRALAEREQGILTLIGADEVDDAPPAKGERFYQHVTPWNPFGQV
jgi:three-Cys-motif partner protein